MGAVFSSLATDPTRLAVRMAGSDDAMTYAELDGFSNQVAQLLRADGVGVGGHVSILCHNCLDYLGLCFGAYRSGVYFTCVSYRLQEEEIAYILENSGTEVIFVSPELVPHVQASASRLPKLRKVYVVGDREVDGAVSLTASLKPQPTTPVMDECLGAAMLYSSGTTGRPKGVKPLLIGGEIQPPPVAGLLQLVFGMTATSIYLSPAPLYHAAPLAFCMSSLHLGATVVVMPRFEEETALQAIEQYQITHSQWVPTMFVRMLKQPKEVASRYDLSTHECAIHAAAPCPIEIKRQMIEWWGPIIHEYYAGSEGIGFTWCDSAQWLEHPGTVGRAVTGTVRVLGEDGNEVPAGEEGSIFFETETKFEYHNDPGKTQDSTSKQGYKTLGDVGYLDADGYLYLTDRKANMIISGGVNVYPQETENTLISHPMVADAAVFGVPDEDFGEQVKAVVQLVNHDHASPQTESEIIEWLRARLSAIKCPRSVDFMERLPREENGKLYKRRLKDQYWKKTGRRI